MSNTIKKDDPRLTAFVLGELSTADSEEIQAAVSNSPELASAVEEIRNVIGLLGEAYQTESPLSLLDHQKSELERVVSQQSEHRAGGLQATVAAKPGSSSASAKSKTSRPWLPIALAASLLGLMAGSLYFSQVWENPQAASKIEQFEKLDRSAIKEIGARADASKGSESEKTLQDKLLVARESTSSHDRRSQELVFTEPNLPAASAPTDSESNVSRYFSDETGERESKPVEFNGKPEIFSADSTEPSYGYNKSSGGQDVGGQEGDRDRNGQDGQRRLGVFGGDDGRPGQSAGERRFAEIAEERLLELDEAELMFSRSKAEAPAVMVPRSAGIQIDVISADDAEARELSGEMAGSPAGSAKPQSQRGSSSRTVENGLSTGDLIPSEQQAAEIVDYSVDGGAGGGVGTMVLPSQPGFVIGGAFGSSVIAPAHAPAQVSPTEVPEVPAQLQGLGLDLVTRTRLETKTRKVPVTRMVTRSKTVPVQRKRTERRTRMVNGKEENYEVEVPYTENVTQNYTVQVPVTSTKQESHQVPVPYYAIGLPEEKADQLILELARNLDPNGKTQFELKDLLQRSAQKVKAKKDSMKSPALARRGLAAPAPAKDANQELKNPASQAQRLASVLSEGFKGESAAEARKLGFDASGVLGTLEKSLAKRNAEIRRKRSWKRVKAVPNTTRLMVGDKDELDLTGMQVNVQVDGFRARVLIDCFYYNDRASQLEGNFKLRLPDDASLYYFAFGESAYDLQPKGELAESEFLDDGTQFVSLGAPEIRKARKDAWANVKEARMVPREKAAHAYRETVRRKVDPALVEWSGAGVFNARVFPLAPQKLHRIVIGYDVNLTRTDDGWAYQLDLPEEPGQCQVDLNIQPIAGVQYKVTPDSDPLEHVVKGKSHQRYQFNGKQENGVRVTAYESPQILLHSSDEDEGDFWGIQIKPDLPIEKVAGSPVGIFMVDTSLSSDPDKFNVWLEMLRATLTNNRDSLKHFNVLFFNVDGHFWKDSYVANTPENVEELMATCDTLALEGATDLYGAFEQIASSDWAYRAPESSNSPRRPDLFLLSDGAATWGETNLRLIGRQIADNNLGSLFAYQTGLTGTSISSLRFLAGQSGGAVFSITTQDEIKTASTAHRKRPWKLKSVAAFGATDTLTAGRVQWVYPGQSLTIVGRGELDGPIELELDQASEEKKISISLDQIEQVESELASRLYGQIAVGQLESLGAKVFDVSASYARHFRVTGDTCSLLMLESEADYKRFDIKPEEDLFVIKSKVAKDLIEDTLRKSSDQLADPKAQTLAWLERLETMPGMSFKMPTALKLAMDEIEIVPISKPLECSLTTKDELSKDYLSALGSERLDYEKISAEADRRSGTSVDEAIKVFSSLVERNPGDIVIARDVAFTAMELDRPAQAFHLLKRVARARPFQGNIYPALGQCLAQLGQSDMAIVYYEVALGGTFSRQGGDFKQIVSTEYMHLLRQITSGKLDSSVPDFAAARLETMEKNSKFNSADLVITMLWNTDQTDVDLHIVEPSGEECSYENKRTRSNGQITSDITTGFGPEMYFNAEAPQGKYDIKVKYFGKGQNRTELRNKVHLMIYRNYGSEDEKVDRRTIQLKTVGEKESVTTLGVD